MACFYPEDCAQYAVVPMLVSPCYSTKCCEDPPICYPRLPRCPPTKVAYCYEKKPPLTPPRSPTYHHDDPDCCEPPSRKCKLRSPTSVRKHSLASDSCPTCCHSTSKPVKTKYVMPCYRYEDGRIEQYVPTRHGRLPMSAYSRNGMQDQIHGYRGAIRYICASEAPEGYCVYTAVEPMRRLYPKNQPTVLMRRACEVACGVRPRRVPFVTSSYCADPYNEVRRYHSQDDRGNCCYHFERNKPSYDCAPVCNPCPLTCPSAYTPHSCEYVDCVHARPVDPPCCYFK